MNFNTNNLLCFHLNLFNSLEQVEKMIVDRNLPNLDPNTIWDSKMNGRLKVWIDKDTHEIMFWTQKGEKKGTICINSHYLTEIHNMKSICYDKREKTPVIKEEPKAKTASSNFDPSELNQSILNIILDKISSKGIGSLSDKEKDFLSRYSD